MQKQRCARFADIRKMIPWGDYSVDVGWQHIEAFLEEMTTGRIEMDPDFQRGHVWTKDKQIAYVEYILQDGQASRQILWNCADWASGPRQPQRNLDDTVYLVDGKQRLQAVRLFMASKIPAFGTLFQDYEDSLMMVKPTLRFHVNVLQTRAEMLRWYLELNTGGVVHTKEELDKVWVMLEAETKAKKGK